MLVVKLLGGTCVGGVFSSLFATFGSVDFSKTCNCALEEAYTSIGTTTEEGRNR